jgi:hypothetical protein
MKKIIKLCALCLTIVSALAFSAKAETADSKKQIEELKKSYPLATCVVSGQKLETTAMGEPIDYLYQQKDANGKETTRLVRFCCPACVKKFTKSPDKFLKMIDEASKQSSTMPAGHDMSHM